MATTSTSWENIKAGALSAIEQMKKGARTATDKAGEWGRIGVLRVEIANIQGKINKNFLNLGSDVYVLINEQKETNIAENEKVQSYLSEIAQLKQEIEAKEEEIKKLSEDQNG